MKSPSASLVSSVWIHSLWGDWVTGLCHTQCINSLNDWCLTACTGRWGPSVWCQPWGQGLEGCFLLGPLTSAPQLPQVGQLCPITYSCYAAQPHHDLETMEPRSHTLKLNKLMSAISPLWCLTKLFYSLKKSAYIHTFMKIMLNGGSVGQFKPAATMNVQNRQPSDSPRTAYPYYSLKAKRSDGQPITCSSWSARLPELMTDGQLLYTQSCHPPT